MPRPLRPIEDGLIYHVIDRGNNRQDVFHKEGDFKSFLQAIADLKQRRPFELFGYCLVRWNRFPLAGAKLSPGRTKRCAKDGLMLTLPGGMTSDF